MTRMVGLLDASNGNSLYLQSSILFHRKEFQMSLLSRHQLAQRWSVSIRTIDKLRASGALPWLDMNLGGKRKPLVRFKLEDVEVCERMMKQATADVWEALRDMSRKEKRVDHK